MIYGRWLNPLVRQGNKRNLEDNDLYLVAESDSTKWLGEELEKWLFNSLAFHQLELLEFVLIKICFSKVVSSNLTLAITQAKCRKDPYNRIDQLLGHLYSPFILSTVYKRPFIDSINETIKHISLQFSIIHPGCFYSSFSSTLLLRGDSDYSIDTVSELTRRSARGNYMSDGLAQGPYVVARVGFEDTTFRAQGTELTTEPPLPTFMLNTNELRTTKWTVVIVPKANQDYLRSHKGCPLVTVVYPEYCWSSKKYSDRNLYLHVLCTENFFGFKSCSTDIWNS